MRADGGEAWTLTDAKEGVVAYSWAPDSRRLAFVATDPRSNEETAQIKKRDDERVFEGDFRYGTCGSWRLQTVRQATRVTEGRDLHVQGPPSWSPEGKRLVFSADVTPMLRDNRQDVYIADIASRQIDKDQHELRAATAAAVVA